MFCDTENSSVFSKRGKILIFHFLHLLCALPSTKNAIDILVHFMISARVKELCNLDQSFSCYTSLV